MTSPIPTTHYGKPFKDLKKVFIDFEYNGTTQAKFDLVCCSFTEDGDKFDIWTYHDADALARLKSQLLSMRETHIFVAFNVVAEASSFIALNLDPTKFAWLDIQLEYKMLTNHWNKYRYGEQLLNGKESKTYPPKPKWDMTEEEKKKHVSQKPEINLAACTYKMLGKVRDTAHKKTMRDLIISTPKEFSPQEQQAILKYCSQDVEDLPLILAEVLKAYRNSTAKRAIFYSELAWRGNSAARTALMSQIGYPVCRKSVTKFSKSVNKILNDLSEDINDQFPNVGLFTWNKNENRYSKKEKPQKDWIAACEYADVWTRTDGGGYSLSLDAYSKHYSYRHDYPKSVFPAQLLRYLKTKQSLNGLVPSKNKKNFFHHYGKDGRARAWLNPYGSQSSRFQPKATGFIPLKSAWMRSMIQPPRGSAIVGIDYGSEEFLLAALLSKDKKMYEAYASGDPYFHFAKLAKAVPADALRKDHEPVRNLFKSTCLGISYLMAKDNLAIKLSEDTGEYHTPEDAQKLIDTFFSVFDRYAAWIERTGYEYQRRSYLKLPDGWIMFGDNRNHRSVSNCPVQGMGACVLRKAIEISQSRGLKVMFPLHDALYAEFKLDSFAPVDTLYDSMAEAFRHYFKDDEEVYEWAKDIRMDIDVWGPGLGEGKFITLAGHPYKHQEIYIDPRSRNEYELFRKYL